MGLLYSNFEYNQRISAVSGTLTKTYKDSYFVRFKKGSKMEREYLNDNYCFRHSGYGSKTEIVVLQVMLMSEDDYVVEAIDKDKYNKLFELKEEE